MEDFLHIIIYCLNCRIKLNLNKISPFSPEWSWELGREGHSAMLLTVHVHNRQKNEAIVVKKKCNKK